MCRPTSYRGALSHPKKKERAIFNYQIYDDHHKSSFIPRPSTFRSTDNNSVKFSFNKTEKADTMRLLHFSNSERNDETYQNFH